MHWRFLAIIGTALLLFGIFFVVYGTSLPVYYAGGGTGISMTNKVVGGLAPSSCEIPIVTIPDTIHVHVRSIEPVVVRIEAPNGTTVTQWQNETVNEDLPISELGFWHVTFRRLQTISSTAKSLQLLSQVRIRRSCMLQFR